MARWWVAVVGSALLGLGCTGAIDIPASTDEAADGDRLDDAVDPGPGGDDQTPTGTSDAGLDTIDDTVMDAAAPTPACEQDSDCDDSIDCTLDLCVDGGARCTHSAPDLDGDGYGSAACLDGDGQPVGDDCNDDANDQNPGQVEFCDGVDNNCNGIVDEDTVDVNWYADTDSDGFGSDVLVATQCLTFPGASVNSSDCDDGDRNVNPDRVETCNDVDDDCDGKVDEHDDCTDPPDDPDAGPQDPCNGGTVNDCGGCTTLAQPPGSLCGPCQFDVRACTGDDATACDGTTYGNACNGCGVLEPSWGSACGSCGLDTFACDGPDAVACSGDTAGNACGGCSTLSNEPDDACGPCGIDRYYCTGAETVGCDGTTSSNGCGGCSDLSTLGDPCGTCNQDSYVCDGTNAVICSGDTRANACQGCDALPQPLGSACGMCGLDAYICDGTEDVICDGDTASNACGGCGDLSQLGTSCGSCGQGSYECDPDDDDAVVCIGDSTNACGGCATLAGEPGLACGTCGLYECSGAEFVTCVGDLGAQCVGSAGCGVTNPPGSGTFNIDVDDTSREYRVGIPTSYDPAVPHKLIFVWHGLGGTAASVEQWSFYGVESYSDGSAIFVAGQGLDTGDGAGWPNTGGRDVAFVRAILAQLRPQYCIDESRIFSTGISYGGIMSNTVGCALGDEFRAIAPIMGSGPQGTYRNMAGECIIYSQANCTGQVAVWLTHGTEDQVVPFCLGVFSRDYWRGANSCASTSTSIGSNGCIDYDGCDQGYPVIWCETSLAHSSPPFAAEEVWNFFAQF